MLYPITFIINEFNKRILSADFNINLYLHFLFLFTFLTIFFIVFIRKISSNAFNGEVKHLSGEIVEKNIHPLRKNKNFNEVVKTIPSKQLYNLYNQEDSVVKNFNDGLINNVISILIFSWILFIVIVVLLKYQCGVNLHLEKIIVENVVAFTFIGAFEYYFFTRIAASYVPIAPSFISQEFLDSIKDELINSN